MRRIFSTFLLLVFSGMSVLAADVRSLSSGNPIVDTLRVQQLNQQARELTYVNPTEALNLAREAMALSEKIGYASGQGYALRNIAAVLSLSENYNIAAIYLQRAQGIFEQLGDSLGIANTFISLGHIFRFQESVKDEVDYHKKAYDFFKSRPDFERRGVTAHNLGESYYHLGNLQMAEALTNEAIQINDSINNLPVLSSCHKVLGLIALSREQFEEAQSQFKKVLEISAVLGDNSQKLAETEALLRLAEIDELMNHFDSAFTLLIRATKTSEQIQSPKLLRRSYLALVANCAKRKDNQGAVHYLNVYNKISTELERTVQQDRADLTKNTIRGLRLEQDNKELSEMTSLQSSRIEIDNVILVGLLVLVVALGGWFYNYYASNKKLAEFNKRLLEQSIVIERQNEKLNDLNDVKNKLFTVVAHDLRSPLVSMKALAELLVHKPKALSEEQLFTLGREMDASVSSTITLADNLIRWASVQMKEYKVSISTFQVEELAASVLQVMAPDIRRKELSVSCDIPKQLTVLADMDHIEFVLRNVLANAIKFSKAGDVIQINASRQGDFAVIQVKDQGIGMSKEKASSIFEFSRNRSTEGTHGERGSGFGLLLSGEFVKLNGGKISLTSQPGQGTTVEFSVPISNTD